MTERQWRLNGIPALLLGEPSRRVVLFLRGAGGNKEEARAFAQVVCPKGYQVLGIDLPGHGVRKGSEPGLYPWTAVPELKGAMAWLKEDDRQISIRANSIGAWLAMMAFSGEPAESLFVSPVLDMERLIRTMMTWAGVTEERLKAEGEIPTEFGETLSWRYYTYVKEHPILNWRAATHILYAGGDHLTARADVERFAAAHEGSLTVMEDGEHWFHTGEQLAFLRNWEDRMTG